VPGIALRGAVVVRIDGAINQLREEGHRLAVPDCPAAIT
jgi:hypothetical protein